MAAGVFRQRGFQAHKQEVTRRDAAFEAKRGKLFRFYLKDGDEDIPVRFLTAEPILFYEHSYKEGGRTVEYTCTGPNCEHCADGEKQIYKGAWLVTDGREVEVKEYKNNQATGKKIKVRDRLKLYVRGTTDIGKLDRLNNKFGLLSRPWFATKTGANQSTSYELDRGEEDELTTKQLDQLMSQLPDKYRKLYRSGDLESLLDIVEAQIFGIPGEEDDSSSGSNSGNEEYGDDDEEADVESGVQSVDDAPRKAGGLFKKPAAAGSKPSVGAGIKPSVSPKPTAKAPIAPKPATGLIKPKAATKPGIRPLSVRK